MAMTAFDYRSQLQSLLPRGLAWAKDQTARLAGLLLAWADEFARVDARCDDLINEADPRTTSELLPDWERVAGLPDPCALGVNTTLQERRLALVSKLTMSGGQSIAYFQSIAIAMGYDITIGEYRPFQCGISQCGIDTLWDYGHAVRHHWTVTVHGPRVTNFRCGQSECGIDPITKWTSAEDLECRFNKYKPAHTALHFVYLP